MADAQYASAFTCVAIEKPPKHRRWPSYLNRPRWQKVDKPCVKCGGQFTPYRPTQKYCSLACKPKKDHTKPPKTAPNLQCKGCGRLFQPKSRDRTTYCSRECAFANNHQRSYKPKGQRTEKVKPLPSPRFCKCGTEVERPRLVCDACIKPLYEPRPRVIRHCLDCGLVLQEAPPQTRRCTPCQKKHGRKQHAAKHGRVKKHRERARRFGVAYEPINPMTVFDRDRWHCQICGCKTPKKLRGTYEANAPELDHIMPMALGGSHTWLNVQCACRQCNIRKGSTKALGQMQLFDRVA